MRPFELIKARDATHSIALTAEPLTANVPLASTVQYLAGGTNLIDLMKLEVATPSFLIDLAALADGYGAIEANSNGLRMGAFVRMAQAEDHPLLRGAYPVLSDALHMAASPQLRNMATLGGNVLQRTRCNYFRDTSWQACNKRQPGSGCAAIGGVNRRLAVLGVSPNCIANYPGDFGIALVALGASVEVLGKDGQLRRILFEDLHRTPGDTPHLETNLATNELIVAVAVPAGPWTRRSLFLKIRDRASYDFALASAAVALELDTNGVVVTARIGLGGLVAKPWRAHVAEDVLTGRRLNEASAREAAEAAFVDATVHEGTKFKPELGRQTLTRALLQAADMEILP